jgi:hypothetical protein
MNVLSQLGGSSYAYVGCFADNTNGRDLPISTAALIGGDRQASLIDCAGQCAGYEYMGLQWTSECYCGNSYGSQGSAECPDDCGLPTSGTGCGGRNAIYSGTFFLPPAAPCGPPSLHCTSSACDPKTNNPGPTNTNRFGQCCRDFSSDLSGGRDATPIARVAAWRTSAPTFARRSPPPSARYPTV